MRAQLVEALDAEQQLRLIHCHRGNSLFVGPRPNSIGAALGGSEDNHTVRMAPPLVLGARPRRRCECRLGLLRARHRVHVAALFVALLAKSSRFDREEGAKDEQRGAENNQSKYAKVCEWKVAAVECATQTATHLLIAKSTIVMRISSIRVSMKGCVAASA